eukprot:scaffold3269_cov208-Chaetoceros_neogracile.AAC.1
MHAVTSAYVNPARILSATVANLMDHEDRNGAVHHVDYTNVADLLQWLRDNIERRLDYINAINENGNNTLLHYACKISYNASSVVINGLLVKLHEKVINAINERGETALHVAYFHKASSEVINGLLGTCENGAS